MKKEPTLLAQFDVTVNSPTPNWHAFRRRILTLEANDHTQEKNLLTRAIQRAVKALSRPFLTALDCDQALTVLQRALKKVKP